MVKTNKLQLFSTALAVAFAFSGCRGRQVHQPAPAYHSPVQSHQHFGVPGQGNQLMPTPDTLPPAAPPSQGGPALSDGFQNLQPISSARKRGISRLLPMFRSKKTQQNLQMPAEGTILTEEQFNALSGQTIGMPMPPMQQQQMQPIPDSQLPPVTRAPQPIQSHQPQASMQVQQPLQNNQVPAHQVGFSGGVPIRPASSVRHQTPVQSQTPQHGLIRNFGSKTFDAAANMNFGGAWGQKAPQTNHVQQQPAVAAYGDPLEIPSIDESYDLWPQSPVEEPVTHQSPPSFGMPATSVVSGNVQPDVGTSSLMRVTDQSLQQVEQSPITTEMLPLIVPAAKNQ